MTNIAKNNQMTAAYSVCLVLFAISLLKWFLSGICYHGMLNKRPHSPPVEKQHLVPTKHPVTDLVRPVVLSFTNIYFLDLYFKQESLKNDKKL